MRTATLLAALALGGCAHAAAPKPETIGDSSLVVIVTRHVTLAPAGSGLYKKVATYEAQDGVPFYGPTLCYSGQPCVAPTLEPRPTYTGATPVEAFTAYMKDVTFK